MQLTSSTPNFSAHSRWNCRLAVTLVPLEMGHEKPRAGREQTPRWFFESTEPEKTEPENTKSTWKYNFQSLSKINIWKLVRFRTFLLGSHLQKENTVHHSLHPHGYKQRAVGEIRVDTRGLQKPRCTLQDRRDESGQSQSRSRTGVGLRLALVERPRMRMSRWGEDAPAYRIRCSLGQTPYQVRSPRTRPCLLCRRWNMFAPKGSDRPPTNVDEQWAISTFPVRLLNDSTGSRSRIKLIRKQRRILL